MSDSLEILQNLEPPRITRVGSALARLGKHMQNTGFRLCVAPEDRFLIINQPPEVLEAELLYSIAGMPGEAGQQVREFFGVDADEARLAGNSEGTVNPQAATIVTGYVVKEAHQAVEYGRPMSLEDTVDSLRLSDLEARLDSEEITLTRRDLEEAAGYLMKLVDHETNGDSSEGVVDRT